MQGGSYEFYDEDFQSFICDNTNMFFYSNPKGGLPRYAVNRTLYEAQIDLKCSTFDLWNAEGQEIVAHFKMPDLSRSSLPNIFVNRTDENQQFFLTTFEEPLTFVTAKSQTLYAGSNIDRDSNIDAYGYRAFVGALDTAKLVQIDDQTINDEVTRPIYLKTESRKNRRYGYESVINLLGYDLLFRDKNDTKMSIEPRDEPVFPYKSKNKNKSVNQMILKFSFVETVWTY